MEVLDFIKDKLKVLVDKYPVNTFRAAISEYSGDLYIQALPANTWEEDNDLANELFAIWDDFRNEFPDHLISISGEDKYHPIKNWALEFLPEYVNFTHEINPLIRDLEFTLSGDLDMVYEDNRYALAA